MKEQFTAYNPTYKQLKIYTTWKREMQLNNNVLLFLLQNYNTSRLQYILYFAR